MSSLSSYAFSFVLAAMLVAPTIPRATDQPASPDRSSPPSATDNDKRREERKKLSSEEREAKSKDWEKKREEFRKMTPEQREAKRQEFKARLEKRMAELRQKQTNGTITAEQLRHLGHCAQVLKRFEQASTPRKEPGPRDKRRAPGPPGNP